MGLLTGESGGYGGARWLGGVRAEKIGMPEGLAELFIVRDGPTNRERMAWMLCSEVERSKRLGLILQVRGHGEGDSAWPWQYGVEGRRSCALKGQGALGEDREGRREKIVREGEL